MLEFSQEKIEIPKVRIQQVRNIPNNTITIEKHFYIPIEYKIIAKRVTVNNGSPLFGLEWGSAGCSMHTNGQGRGLFGSLLSQTNDYISIICFNEFICNFQIIEVDARDLVVFDNNNFEIEFKRCNILYNGEINGFLDSIKNYANYDQYINIVNDLSFKVKELSEAYESFENYCKYYELVKSRSLSGRVYIATCRKLIDEFLSENTKNLTI